MTQSPQDGQQEFGDSESQILVQMAHGALRLVLAVRYRKYLVASVMITATLLGSLYYVTATRMYSSKAAMLVTQTGPDQLDTSITNEASLRENTMPTFEKMLTSAKVLEGAVKKLGPSDRVDLGDGPPEHCIGALRKNLVAKAVKFTSIIETSYESKDPQVAANVVRAVVQSYLDFMEGIHRGTAGEISRMLTKEREELAEKLSHKQQELLECRRHFADMGFRSEGKTLHPTVQRAVFFNDTLIAAQKQRVEQEALLASLRTALANGEDLGQYMVSVGDAVGKEMLLNNLGLSGRDVNSQVGLEQGLIGARAELQTAQQNLGPNHPEVVSLVTKVRLIEQFLESAQDRIGQRVSRMRQNQLGPWLVQMVQQKLDESRKKEEMLKRHFEETRAEAINLSGQLAQIELLERDVKRLNEMNDVLLNQIASLDLKQNGQEIRVAVIEEPTVAGSPTSPRLVDVVASVVIGGFGLSLLLVTLLDALDDRFRSIEEMQSRLGLSLLAMIQRLDMPENAGVQSLVTHVAPTSTASENFRTLRTALTLTHPDARQLIITSAEPGDGKTTTLANLAVCYAQADKRTLLIDADLRRPGLTALMNMRGPHGLSELLRSDADVSQLAPAYIRDSGVKQLDVLPCGSRPSDPAELLAGPRFSQLLSWAESEYDVILIDSPPTLATTDTAIMARLVDGVILVVQPAKNRRRMVMRAVERLSLMKIGVIGLVVNRTGSNEDQGYYGYHSYGYGDAYGYGYGGSDGDDNAAQTTGTPESDVRLSFADRDSLCNEEEPMPPLTIPRRVA